MPNLVSFVRSLISKVFFKLIPPSVIIKKYEDDLIRINTSLVTMGKDSHVSKFAIVHNMPKDPSRIKIGRDTMIDGELLIFNYGGKINVGDNVYVGKGSRIWSGEEIYIGNNVLISHNVNISDTNAHEIDYNERAIRFREIRLGGHPQNKSLIQTGPIMIDDHVWINNDSIILKGVKIGKGAIIAAGSVVLSDVEPFTLVGGNPAKKIKELILK